MGQFRKVEFIINPYSGKQRTEGLQNAIAQYCSKSRIEFDITFTEGPGHATEIAKHAIEKNFDAVFAVGGDGTVNETAKGLINTNAVMGILPKGSGNGLSRHLGIPQKPEKALRLIDQGTITTIDSLSINGELSVNVSGVGFDGHIANLFGAGGKRGLKEYVSIAASEFRKFKNFKVHGTVDDAPIDTEAFILAVANSSQFGNNATISPLASVCDGIMDLCIIRKVPLLQGLGFAGKMFTKRMHKSAFAKIIQCKKAEFTFHEELPYHVDGEGRSTAKKFSFEIRPGSLKVLTSSNKI